MASLNRPRFAARGLTLAEVMMAAGILVVVLLLMIGVFIGGLQLMERSEVHTAASSIGREVLETIEDDGGFAALPLSAMTFDGAVPDAKVDGFPPDPYPKAQRDGRDYVIKVQMRKIGTQGRSMAVLVTVDWDGGRIQLERVFHAADAAL